MLIRCSSIYKIMTEPRSKKENISDTAKSLIREMAKKELFGFDSFDGNKYTSKGNALEPLAIQASGLIRASHLIKNEERISNDWVTGECDVLTPSFIIDEKCSWDVGTHPFFKEEAETKVKKMGYDYQMQGYMWLYGVNKAYIDFWLFPCPDELISTYDNAEKLIDIVESIPLEKRITTVEINRDDDVIERVKTKVEACRAYYESLINELEAA